jgi:hypothetical protein
MEGHITAPAPTDVNGGGATLVVSPPAENGAVASPEQKAPSPTTEPTDGNDGIGGISALRGLVLYGAVLTFAGLYIDFMVRIVTAKSGPPGIDTALISAAAALSGVLGSAFALKIGVKPSPAHVNAGLAAHLAAAARITSAGKHERSPLTAWIRRALSLEPSGVDAKSWPLTFGIWAYAAVGSAVAVVYIFNQNQTPGAVKALAVTFGGYVIALVNTAYGMVTKQSTA